jgi:ABC-type nitrate/sulfonate/bicarbonate transport system substrate-binding protein
MRRRRFLGLALAAPGALAIPSILRAQAPVPTKVATGVTPPSIYNIWMHVALEHGHFRNNGIEVTEFMQLRGGPLAIQAIAAGEVDIAPADPEGLLGAAVSGHAIRGVAAPGCRPAYMVVVRKEIASLAELAGQPFAISRPGAISQYLMFPLLDSAGVSRDAVEWVGVGSGADRLLALKADRVKGALLNVDAAMEASEDPDIMLIQSVAETLQDYPVELLVLRKDLIDEKPDVATAVTRAVIQACRDIVENKAATIDVVLKYAPGMKREVLERAYDELIRIKGFGVNGGITDANLKVAHDLALQNGQIAEPVPSDRWVDLRPQERAIAELGEYTWKH